MNKQEDNEPIPDEAGQVQKAKRERFIEWCNEHEEDPEDEGAWDSFNEIDSFWDEMDEDNRAGHTDDMNKD